MTISRREEVAGEIRRRRIGAIVRATEEGLAADAAAAAVAGGVRIVEFTLTTPNALELIAQSSADARLLVGAGTVMSVSQARAAVDAGASFLVSPVCDPAVIAEACALDVVSIPGTFTATEMNTAHRCGADFVKLFPAPADVAEYVRSILGPMPYLSIFPTNGVTVDNFVSVLRAGAAGVAFTGALFTPEDMDARRFDVIEKRAAEIMQRFEAV
ncbi:MAG: bifunctional 4-hydroxy-2-oxoglutarate aldolase/2-dehydro-3-deoxy-phosphogluconate aldolase [bacterium]|nr:bifunctional 4-hydroxy-2-oxoglutarate aldolase/2-dehydro-3-deoxy-phosphogluconate aldolase [bacterium]